MLAKVEERLKGGHVRFTDGDLNVALDAALRARRAYDRAVGHNVTFEERVSDERRVIAEHAAKVAGRTERLGDALEWHYKSRITVDAPTPPTFTADNGPASYGPIEPNQMILRIENLTWVMNNVLGGRTFFDRDELEKALFAKANDTATREQENLIETNLLNPWNADRDLRPAFAAFEGEVGPDAQAPDWPVRLRNRFGLAHYNPSAGRRFLVALMRYSAAEVLEAARKHVDEVAHPFCAPTVLDAGNWAYFFPAPQDTNGGRALNLEPILDWNALFAEILHFRIPYSLKHILKLAWLEEETPRHLLVALRNAHLEALRIVAEREDFGEMMPDDLDEP